MKNLSTEKEIEMAIKLTVSDAVEKSFNIENLELRKKLIIKYMSTETFKKSVLSYLELITTYKQTN
jgi:hypothetical protein